MADRNVEDFSHRGTALAPIVTSAEAYEDRCVSHALQISRRWKFSTLATGVRGAGLKSGFRAIAPDADFV
jgi:hypothetical protein